MSILHRRKKIVTRCRDRARCEAEAEQGGVPPRAPRTRKKKAKAKRKTVAPL
jgi:hypothetical protein